jgi:hypothetical protein
MKFRILFFVIALLLSGCVIVETCDDNSDSELVARFKTLKEEVSYDSIVSPLTLYGIREGMADSLIYDSVSTSTLTVPLDPHHDTSRFVMLIGETSDTLVVSYRREIYMISYTCGFGTLFTIDHVGYSTGLIRDHSVVKNMVDAANEENEEHIWLYL